ncbi:MAG: hypothetical protein L3J71_09375 [Victivallaceae bacterium]|nr:hypothetical protein [Victivallaceae bacterium]
MLTTTIRKTVSRNVRNSLLLFAIFVAANISAADSGKRTVPFTQCPTTDLPVKIDGNLDEAAWNATPILAPFVTVHGDHYPVAQTEVRMLHNKQSILFAIKVFEPAMDKVRAKITNHDGGVWRDDSIEIFIKPENSADYYQFIANSSGVMEESKNRKIDWNSGWQVKAGRFARGWTLEIAIPVKAVGIKPELGSIFSFNVCRERPHAREYSAWSNPHGSFHNKAFFAEAIFVDRVSFWWSLRRPGKILTASSFMTLDAQGQIGTYKVTVTTYESGIKKATKQHEIKFVAGDRHSFEIPFLIPGMKQPGVRLAASNSDGKNIFETGILPLTISDPTEYELTRAGNLLKAIKQGIRLREWRKRFAALKQHPDVLLLQKLSQEMEISTLTAKLPKSHANVTALPFTVPPFRMTQYDFVPQLSELKKSPYIIACKGEYEPASVNLLALKNLKKVVLTISDLKTKNGQRFAVSDIEVRIVKNWYQAGTGSTVGSQAVFVPELLVKDDAVIIPNHKTKRNIFKFNEKIGPVEPKILQPVNITEFQNRQFWLLAHIPDNQQAGNYSGKIKFTADGKLLASIPLKITVLPMHLEKSRATFSMYNHARYSMGKNPDRDIFYEKMLAMCKAYGMNSLMVQEGKRLDKNGRDYSNYKFNIDAIRKAFELRQKYGLTSLTLAQGVHWMDQWLDRIWKLKTAELEKGDDPVIAAYIDVCRKIKQAAMDAGFPAENIFIATHDEPGYDSTGERLKQARLINALTHQAGVKTAEAITAEGARKLGPANLDMPIFSGEGLSIGKRRQKVDVPLGLHYYHPLEDPRHDRLLSGMVVWYNKLDGAIPYALAALGGWDDWKGYGSYRPERYIYDGKRTPIPTIQFEAFREGVDDYKYLEMIERRCVELKNRQLTSKQQAILAKALDLLNQPPKVFQGSFAKVKGEVTAADFVALRRKMQRLLAQLEEIMNKTK